MQISFFFFFCNASTGNCTSIENITFNKQVKQHVSASVPSATIVKHCRKSTACKKCTCSEIKRERERVGESERESGARERVWESAGIETEKATQRERAKTVHSSHRYFLHPVALLFFKQPHCVWAWVATASWSETLVSFNFIQTNVSSAASVPTAPC